MSKNRIQLRDRKEILIRFIETILDRKNFLIAGHEDPDEDSVNSTVVFALLAAKLNKKVSVVLDSSHHKKFKVPLSICHYNNLPVIDNPEKINPKEYDTVVVCDTAKPSMVEYGGVIFPIGKRAGCITMEIDHHFGADSDYSGDPEYRLVDEASSTCELMGLLALEFSKQKIRLGYSGAGDMLSRNIVLCVLSGIISDTKTGLSVGERAKVRAYKALYRRFRRFLKKETYRKSRNMKTVEDVLTTISLISEKEARCFQVFRDRMKISNHIFCVCAVDEQTSIDAANEYGPDLIPTVARHATNMSSEISGKIGLVAYYDHPDVSNLIQIRMRRNLTYKELDLREIITRLGIENGGGHAGAIGFRVMHNEIDDYPAFIEKILDVAMAIIKKK